MGTAHAGACTLSAPPGTVPGCKQGPKTAPAAAPRRRLLRIARTRPRGSASGGMGPKWSLGTVTMMRPLAALARPARTARSVVKASSGRSSLLMRTKALLAAGASPALKARMATVSAVLMRGLAANLAPNCGAGVQERPG